MNKQDISDLGVDELILKINELKLEQPLTKTGRQCRNKRTLVRCITNALNLKKLEEKSKELEEKLKEVETNKKQKQEAKVKEQKEQELNKMYKWAEMYENYDNFMSELYTKERVQELRNTTKNKKQIAFMLWGDFTVEQKRNITF